MSFNTLFTFTHGDIWQVFFGRKKAKYFFIKEKKIDHSQLDYITRVEINYSVLTRDVTITGVTTNRGITLCKMTSSRMHNLHKVFLKSRAEGGATLDVFPLF